MRAGVVPVSFREAGGARSMKPVGKVEGLGRALGIGSQLVASTLVGAAIGWWLDRITGWAPWCLVVFFLLGSAAGFLAVYRGLQVGKGPDR